MEGRGGWWGGKINKKPKKNESNWERERRGDHRGTRIESSQRRQEKYRVEENEVGCEKGEETGR